MMTEPGFSCPFFSASSIMARAIRSFALPAGLNPSSFTNNLACNPQARVKRTGSNMGVEPISSVIPWAIVSIIYASSLT